MQEYPELCDVALKILLPFASTYLCEAGFSKMTALKTKYCNRAQIEDDLRLCLSNIEPIIGTGAPTAMNQLWGGAACKRLRTPGLTHILSLIIIVLMLFFIYFSFFFFFFFKCIFTMLINTCECF